MVSAKIFWPRRFTPLATGDVVENMTKRLLSYELNTMSAAVPVYERILKRYPDDKPEDYLFFPQHQDRTTASTMLQWLFMEVLKHGGIEIDTPTGKSQTLYSLRHTAIWLRIINSKGRVNIFKLAKHAGASLDQMGRLYAWFLPLSKERAKNLQILAEWAGP